MQRLNLTLSTPAENIALDEALLDCAADVGPESEFLRIWESPQHLVVAGRSSRAPQEINLTECDARGIPVVRRSSGGAAIVAGPGCLMYAVVLSYQVRPELRDIGRAHRFVLGRIVDALQPLAEGGTAIERAGTSDLVIADRGFRIADCQDISAEAAIQSSKPKAAVWRKFSGNSLRAKRTHFLYHGTLLYDFDLALISQCLLVAPRQPDYREAREHSAFVTNLPANRDQLTAAIDQAWPATGELADVPWSYVEELVKTRFSQTSWNLDFA